MAVSEAAVCNLALLKIGDTKGLIAALTDKSLQAQICAVEYPQVRDEIFAEFSWPRATMHLFPSQLGGSLYDPTRTYAQGDLVSYAPAFGNVVNMPETITTFVYVSLAPANTGNQPDVSPTEWAQVSRPGYAYVFQIPGNVISVQGLYKYGRNPREDQKIPFEIGYDSNIGAPLIYTDTGLPWVEDWTDTSAPHSIEMVATIQVTDPKQFPPLFTAAVYWELAVRICPSIRKDVDVTEKLVPMAKLAFDKAWAAAMREKQEDPPPLPSWIAARLTSRRGVHR